MQYGRLDRHGCYAIARAGSSTRTLSGFVKAKALCSKRLP